MVTLHMSQVSSLPMMMNIFYLLEVMILGRSHYKLNVYCFKEVCDLSRFLLI